MTDEHIYLVKNETNGTIRISTLGKALPSLMEFLAELGYRTATHAEFRQALHNAELTDAKADSHVSTTV